MSRTPFVLALVVLLSAAAYGQSFSSGSTGADGALDLAAMSCTICEIQLPESGILNYTTVNVPTNKTLQFNPNLRNTPVIMLAQGSVTVAGIVNVSASGRVPGPGGFYGSGSGGGPGFGPGGGTAIGGAGIWIGPLSLVPIIGGSGGGGFCTSNVPSGGGGGAIVIASSSSITFLGGASIYANSGTGFQCGNPGSGGAIRLIANALNISGSLNACGYGHPNIVVTCGVIRLEAPQGAINFTGTASPPAVLSTINPAIVPSNMSSLQIVSIGGQTVPAYSGTRFDTVDLLLPNQLTDPISVVVQASNVPVGTQVKIIFAGAGSFTPGTLQGTLASSTATLTVSNLTRTAVTYLFVYATFDPPMTSLNHNPKGKDRVAKVRLEAKPGAKQKFVFLRKDGSEIDAKKLPQAFLQEFGMN